MIRKPSRKEKGDNLINRYVDIEEIEYQFIEPESELLESIKKRGIAIPVRVNCTESGYQCVDGKKRLSACQILQKENPKYRRIPIMLMNDFSKAGSAFWGNTQNKH